MIEAANINYQLIVTNALIETILDPGSGQISPRHEIDALAGVARIAAIHQAQVDG
jgi:hypothetical protein